MSKFVCVRSSFCEVDLDICEYIPISSLCGILINGMHYQCVNVGVLWRAQCSVSCGSGQQTRDVVCIGSDGVPLEDYACGTLSKPPRTQTCEMPACRNPIGWHIGDWGLVSNYRQDTVCV